MGRELASLPDREHWLFRDLLARYAELKQSNRDADAMYPQVAAHLKVCARCRELLADILRPDLSLPETSHKLNISDLSFLRRYEMQPSLQITPGSIRASFRAHISIPLDMSRDMLAAGAQGPELAGRGFGPIQPGGRLLLWDIMKLEDADVRVMVILKGSDSPGQYRIVGELVSAESLPTVRVRLYAGYETYYGKVRNGRFSFDPVSLNDGITDLRLILETED